MSPVSKLVSSSGRAWRLTLAAPVLLLFFASAGNAAEVFAYTPVNRGSAFNAASISSAYFAIADFDGDRKPDLATVQVQSTVSSRSLQYSIRFELSARAAQTFGIIAPIGGLQIVAIDVNGDTFLDLLVSTAWQHEQVAVLLNDGRGNFTFADPHGFAAAHQEDAPRWNLKTALFCDAAVIDRWESSTEGMRSDPQSVHPLPVARFAQSSECFGSNRSLLSLLLGRAPPSVVSLI